MCAEGLVHISVYFDTFIFFSAIFSVLCAYANHYEAIRVLGSIEMGPWKAPFHVYVLICVYILGVVYFQLKFDSNQTFC